MSPADRLRDDALQEARSLEPMIYFLHKQAEKQPSGSVIGARGSDVGGGEQEPANVQALLRLRAIAQGLKALKAEVLS